MEQKAGTATFAGLFAIALATLMFEILLTRIFSVTMWYHFAFMAISVAMFGMTAGAVAVYLKPRFFAPEKAKGQLAASSLLFSVLTVGCFLAYLAIPYEQGKDASDYVSLALIFLVVSAPFFFCGIAVTLALTKFPSQISRLYAADLAGAALGCLLLPLILQNADGPSAVFYVSAVAGLGALLFASDAGSARLRTAAMLWIMLAAGFGAANSAMAVKQNAPLRLRWVKGALETDKPGVLYEKWNSFSRVMVERNWTSMSSFGWGVSGRWPGSDAVQQLDLNIDANASTFLTRYSGKPEQIEHLKYDVVNAAHWLRQDADTLVVGVGGGRDMLAALAFDQKSVTGVEINGDILDTVNGQFRDYTGFLDENPKMTFVHDEARSYIARSEKRYDIIQVSLVDTWAATSAGAFVLTENSLYTREAWAIFLDRLSERGLLSFARWHREGSPPQETYRLAMLATQALLDMGVENPRDHLAIVKTPRRGFDKDGNLKTYPYSVATLIASKSPFDERDREALEAACERMDFAVLLAPWRPVEDKTLEAIASGKDLDKLIASHPVNIAPPTDESPFFFHMIPVADIFDFEAAQKAGVGFNAQAMRVLGALVVITTVLCLLFIALPLAVASGGVPPKETAAPLLYFAGIGLGFMLVEISLMQRLSIFLGHPTYGLVVALFSLLLASGIGSYCTGGVSGEAPLRSGGAIRWAALLGLLALTGFLAPWIVANFEASPTPMRLLIGAGLLAPAGFFMGMAFPIGMKAAGARWPGLTPWLWGVNGATSVTASALCVAISIATSISTSFWAGVACYALAAAALLFVARAPLAKAPKEKKKPSGAKPGAPAEPETERPRAASSKGKGARKNKGGKKRKTRTARG